jgi:hypothetical protein
MDESFQHPYYDQTLGHALSLARSIKYGPLPKEKDPTPTLEESLELLKREMKVSGYNNITARVAKELVEAALGVPDPFTT